MAAQATRPYQVIVWGASGFTGKLVCEHLTRDYQGRVRWAMAGRNFDKLSAVRDDLAKINPAVKDVPILVADSRDSASLGKVIAQTEVVLALAGPFAKYGNEVVAQAVEQGTHYCDITGEIPWVKRMAEKHHKAAEAKGVKIVHCCGYDSVPSDLGTLMMVDYCEKTLGKKVDQVYSLFQGARGAASGGTVGTIINVIEEEKNLAALNSDVYYLAGAVTGKKGNDKPAPFTPTYLPAPKTWAGPFFMEGCNARVVHYSNAIRPTGPYGTNFKFCEMAEGGQGWNGWLKASLTSLGIMMIGIAFVLPPTRALVKRFMPSGSGPSLELQRTGYWSHRMVAVTEAGPGQQPTIVEGFVGDRRDPGYWSTSRIILEAGLSLVLDADKIAKSGACRQGGLLTPATAMGMALVDRLRNAGFTWEVKRIVSGPGPANTSQAAPSQTVNA